jgi:hypothetical protein
MNRTLMGKARSILNGVGITQEFWEEAFNTAKYILNVCPSSVLFDTTPHEVWSHKKPSISLIKVFGCDAFLHVPKEKRIKMDKKAEKCNFIGYKEGMKGYKIWHLASIKIVYS